jgi:hypothetical protein
MFESRVAYSKSDPNERTLLDEFDLRLEDIPFTNEMKTMHCIYLGDKKAAEEVKEISRLGGLRRWVLISKQSPKTKFSIDRW